MGAAVRNYATNDTTKGNRFQGQSEDTSLNRQDNHPYRRQHGLTAWDDFSGNGIPEPFTKFEDFPNISKSQLDAFYRAIWKVFKFCKRFRTFQISLKAN